MVDIVKVKQEDNDVRLDRWFKRNYPDVPFGAIQKAIRKGQIRLDGKRADGSKRVMEGQEIRVPPFKKVESSDNKTFNISNEYKKQIKSAVIYEDEEVIVINKPSGIATQAGTNVNVSIDRILEQSDWFEGQVKLVHRLDKDTSGVLIVAKNANKAAKLTKEFKEKRVTKKYLAVLTGVPAKKSGVVDVPIAKKNIGKGRELVVKDGQGDFAKTEYTVLDSAAKQFALVEFRPITGRTHQLRVHSLELGFAILGDGKYGGREAIKPGFSKKLHLHANSLNILGYSFNADMPKHMVETISGLGLAVK